MIAFWAACGLKGPSRPPPGSRLLDFLSRVIGLEELINYSSSTKCYLKILVRFLVNRCTEACLLGYDMLPPVRGWSAVHLIEGAAWVECAGILNGRKSGFKLCHYLRNEATMR